MAYQRRSTANPNRVTLDLDPITSDTLTQAATAQKMTRQRLAYELVQRGLGIDTKAPSTAPTLSETEDRMGELAQRFTTNHKPPGRP